MTDFRVEKHKAMESKVKKHPNRDNVENSVKEVPTCYIYGIMGYRKACEERYEEAVHLCTKAIDLNNKEHRFFSNRSYCYTKLKKFDLALRDAEHAIKLNSQWPKGYYRKAEALLGLEKYKEAERFFGHVLKLEPECGDALDEQVLARALQITEMGFPLDVAKKAVMQYGSVEKALNTLLEQQQSEPVRKPIPQFRELEISPQRKVSESSESISLGQADKKTDVSNPDGHTSLWVGNLTPELNALELKKIFGKYGDVTIHIKEDGKYAFVNFKDKIGPGSAMKALQGKLFFGRYLYIRFPDNPRPDFHHNIVPRKNMSGLKTPSQGECVNWLVSGHCKWGEECKFKHVKEHQGNYMISE